MKYFVVLASIICILLFVGSFIFYLKDNEVYQEKSMGYGALVLFLVLMPAFLIWRYLVKQSKNSDEE